MKKSLKTKRTFNKKYLKIGGYSTIVCAITVVIAVVVIMIVGALPSSLIKLDISGTGMYNITDETKEIINGIDKDVTIYLISEEGNEMSSIAEYCRKYTELNSHIKFEQVDPALRPDFTSKYTEDVVASNSLIVVNASDSRSKVIAYDDIFKVTYSQEDYYNYYYNGITPTGTTTFMIENELTSAMDYVTSDNIPVVYYTSGHNETEIGTQILSYLGDDNYDVRELALKTSQKVPDDASMVIINLPALDLQQEELDALGTYIGNGGSVMLTTAYSMYPGDNLAAFAKAYGIGYTAGLVCEGDASGFYNSRPYMTLTNVTQNDFSENVDLTSSYIRMSVCHPLSMIDDSEDNDINVSVLFSTTDKAYIKTGETNTIEKEDGDTVGTFYTGLMSAKTTESGQTGKLIWIASPDMTSDDTLGYFSNIPYLLSMAKEICGKESSISISGVSMQVASLQVPEKSANAWGIILIGIIPLAVVCTGGIIWSKRRKQ